MKPTVAIIGAGAMGAMYAWHFASTGHGVVLAADEQRAERLRQGLVINGEQLMLPVLSPTDESAPVDLAIVAVKDRHLASAMTEASRVVGAHTTVISVMNGLDSEHELASQFDPGQVLLCVAAGMDAVREGSSIRWAHPGKLLIGTPDGTITPRLTTLASWLSAAGLAHEIRDDMMHQIWWKFMVNVGINQASAAMRADYGAFQAKTGARSLMLGLIDEVIAVAGPEGVHLDQSDVDRWLKVLATMAPDGRTSMCQDTDAGRPTEVESFAGRVIRLGERHGISTPLNQAMYWMLSAPTTPHSTNTEQVTGEQ